MLPLPILVLPPIMIKALPKSASPRIKMAAELVAITLCLIVALPATIALFPQRLELDVDSLEVEFQKLLDADGKPITKVYSNKGL